MVHQLGQKNRRLHGAKILNPPIFRRGFTLVELMIVVAIIVILAAVAVPKFGDMVTKSKEASIKAQLGSIRSAIGIYYSDIDGTYPMALDIIANSSYFGAIPRIAIPAVAAQSNPGHTENEDSRNYTCSGSCASIFADASNDPTATGYRWGYIVPVGIDMNGTAFVNCWHKDSRGNPWTSY